MEGALADEGWKVKGNKEGLWNHWEQDGSGHSGIYKNDLREGVWHFWDADGDPQPDRIYQQGNEIS
jgi:antitoxin component YwqK of YwqJK toxin-antitoxin module